MNAKILQEGPHALRHHKDLGLGNVVKSRDSGSLYLTIGNGAMFCLTSGLYYPPEGFDHQIWPWVEILPKGTKLEITI